MSNTYTIRNSVGSTVTTIDELNRNTTATSLTLHGRGAKQYGFDRDQNIVYMLENFASQYGPANPIDGQVWWDSVNKLAFIWDTSGSPAAWSTVVPPSQGLGFDVVAGDGMVGGGNPIGSPLVTTLDVVGGTGITVTADSITTNDSEIVHDNLNFGSPDTRINTHIDHSAISINAGIGILGGGTLDNSQHFDLFIGGGLGPIPGEAVVISSDVVRTSGNQTIYGAIKSFTQQIQTYSGSAAAPSYAFSSSDTDLGFYHSGTNELSFSTGGTQRFRLESGGVLRALHSSYEVLVTEDDDIPNKKYVDSLSSGTGGVAPTGTTFGGSGFVSGLTIGKKYLVHVYGITRSAGTGMHTLGSVRLTTGSSCLGTLIAQTPTRYLNWPDGNVPQSAHFVVTAISTSIWGCTDYTGAAATATNIPSHMIAIQLD